MLRSEFQPTIGLTPLVCVPYTRNLEKKKIDVISVPYIHNPEEKPTIDAVMTHQELHSGAGTALGCGDVVKLWEVTAIPQH